MAAVKPKSPALIRSYRKARNATNTQLKKKHYNDKITACKGDIKGSWKAINEIINIKSKSRNIDYIKNCGQEVQQQGNCEYNERLLLHRRHRSC